MKNNKIKEVTNSLIKATAKVCAESTSFICFYEYELPKALRSTDNEKPAKEKND